MSRTLAIILLVFLALPVHAQSEATFMEITPYAAYTFGGRFSSLDNSTDQVDLEDSANFGLLLNFRHSSITQWELMYSQQDTTWETGGVTGGDVRIQYLQGGGTYLFDTGFTRPFMSATIGGTHIDAESDGFGSDTFFGFSIGGGVKVAPSARLGLRLEARVFGTLVQSGSSIFCVSDPAGGTAGCAINVAGDVLWQLQTMAGLVFRF